MSDKLIPINKRTLQANLAALTGRYPEEHNAGKIISRVSNTISGDTLLIDRKLTVPDIPGDFTFTFAIETDEGLTELPDTYRYISEAPKEKEPEIEPVQTDPMNAMMTTINGLVGKLETNYKESLATIRGMSESHSKDLADAYKIIDNERAKLIKEQDKLTEERIKTAADAGSIVADAMRKASESMPVNRPVVESGGFLDRFGNKLMDENSATELLQMAITGYSVATGRDIDLAKVLEAATGENIQEAEVNES